MLSKNYPQEHFVEIKSEPYFLGRITLHQVKDHFHADIDIVHRESKKIFHHVGRVHEENEAEEALDLSMERLARFLQGKK